MGASDIIGILTGHNGRDYVPYSPLDTVITVGMPGIQIEDWDYASARHNVPQVKRFGNLGGPGVFVENINKSGIIEIGIMHGMVSGGALEIMEATGIPIPIVITDICTGGTSSVLSTSCRRVGTPEWRRGRKIGIVPYTYEVLFMSIQWGVQLPELDL